MPEEVFKTGISQNGIIRNTSSGKRLSVNATPLNDNGKKKGVLLSIQDVTEIMEKERELDLGIRFNVAEQQGGVQTKINR